jgi:hypothetical protein
MFAIPSVSLIVAASHRHPENVTMKHAVIRITKILLPLLLIVAIERWIDLSVGSNVYAQGNIHSNSPDQVDILDIPLIPQQENTWCFAACIEMVTTYLGSTQSQCMSVAVSMKTAMQLPELPNCCTSDHVGCDVGGTAAPGLDLAGLPYKPKNKTQDFEQGKILCFSKLRQQMQRTANLEGRVGSPVISTWYWKDGSHVTSSHNVLVRGTVIQDSKKYVLVHNPWPPDEGTDGEETIEVSGGDVWVYPYATFNCSDEHSRLKNGNCATCTANKLKTGESDLYDISPTPSK